MASLKTLSSVLLVAGQLIALTSAQFTYTFGTRVITVSADGDSIYGSQACPGVLSITGSSYSDGFCCVGGQLDLSTCPGWPICTGTATEAATTSEVSCAASVPLTASDYSEQVSSALATFNGQAASTTMPASTTGDSTMTGGSATITSNSGATANTASASRSSSSSTSSAGAGNIMVPAGVLGGGFLAAAMML